MARPCVYVNTSIVVRALKPGEPGHLEARRFLEECCSKCRCVYSSVHLQEIPEPYRPLILRYLDRVAVLKRVDVVVLRSTVRRYIVEHGLSKSRELDVMHLTAARLLGCRYILARDRFIMRHAYNFNLTYTNWDTHRGECPCSQSNNGENSATKRENSNTSSQKSKKKIQPNSIKQKKYTRSGSGRKSPTARRRKSSRSSPSNAARHKGHRPSKRRPSKRG